MRYLRKLHNRREPPGLEWTILRRLPMCMVGTVVVPLLVMLGGRWLLPAGSAEETVKRLTSVDIFAFAVGLTALTAVFTVAIGCIVVVIMKGPAYVADGYSPDDPKYTARRDSE